MHNSKSKHTASVHAGTKMDIASGVNTPIHTSTAYNFLAEEMKYPRLGNTLNLKALAEKVAQLSGTQNAIVFSSGMAAISCAMLTLLKPGDHFLIQRNIYGGTYALINGMLKDYGISYTYFEEDKLDDLASLMTPNTRLVYFESPSNPMLKIVDIKKLVAFASKHSLISVTDNTFASPIIQCPADFGVDVILESGSKFMAGHSDIMMGSLACNNALYESFLSTAITLGAVIDAQTAYQLEKSMKTLALRVEQQNKNAIEVASAILGLDFIEQVFFPGLPTHLGCEIAKSQMQNGYGNIVTFNLSNKINVRDYLNRLKLIAPAVSLGGVESTISSPYLTSHKMLSEEERNMLGIKVGTLRLSVGIEAVEEIISDLIQAANTN